MKQYIYCGSTSDGKVRYMIADSEKNETGVEENIELPFYNNYRYNEEQRREYFPFLEPF